MAQKPFWQQRRDAKLANTKKPEAVKRERKQNLAAWYEMQDTQAPAYCENCGDSLIPTINFMSRAHICHIVEKSPTNGCPSVATHPLNRWFGCLGCHTFFDNTVKAEDKKTQDQVKQMPVFPILQGRMKIIYPSIEESERRRVPELLIP